MCAILSLWICIIDLIIIFENIQDPVENTLLTFHLLVLVISILYTAWYSLGKEQIVFQDQYIIHQVSLGKLIFKKRKYQLEDIIAFCINESNTLNALSIKSKTSQIKEMRKAFPFWYKMGESNIVLKNKKINVLNSLNTHYANENKLRLIHKLEEYNVKVMYCK